MRSSRKQFLGLAQQEKSNKRLIDYLNGEFKLQPRVAGIKR